MTATRLAAVVNYLITMAEGLTSTGLSGVTVQDGPPTSQIRGLPKVLVIAGRWEPSTDQRSAARSVIAAGDGNASRRESITVDCSAYSQSGDLDMKPRRDEVFAFVGALEQALVADRTLSGLVMGDTRISAIEGYRPVQNEAGAAAICDFTIAATAALWDG